MTDSHRRQNEIDDITAVLVEGGVRTAGIILRTDGRMRYSVLDRYEPLSEPLESALRQLLVIFLSDDEWIGSADIETATYSFGYDDISSHADDITAWQVYFTANEIK